MTPGRTHRIDPALIPRDKPHCAPQVLPRDAQWTRAMLWVIARYPVGVPIGVIIGIEQTFEWGHSRVGFCA